MLIVLTGMLSSLTSWPPILGFVNALQALPRGFGDTIREELLPAVQLMGDTSLPYLVEVHDVGGRLYFTNGWERFVLAERIQPDDLGLFIVTGPRRISMRLYYRNGLEKPFSARAVDVDPDLPPPAAANVHGNKCNKSLAKSTPRLLISMLLHSLNLVQCHLTSLASSSSLDPRCPWLQLSCSRWRTSGRPASATILCTCAESSRATSARVLWYVSYDFPFHQIPSRHDQTLTEDVLSTVCAVLRHQVLSSAASFLSSASGRLLWWWSGRHPRCHHQDLKRWSGAA